MISTRGLRQVLSTPPGGTHRGRLAANLNTERRQKWPDRSQHVEQLLADLADQPAPPSGAYRHPATDQTPARSARRPDGPLSPVEIAWLQRVPTDPAAVSFTDAQRLADLADAVPPRSPDAALVGSVWDPVREHHDTAAAHAELNAAQVPLPPQPWSAFNAAFDAVKAENGGVLTDAEVNARAAALVQEAEAARQATHAARLATARARVAEVADRKAQRTATTLPPPEQPQARPHTRSVAPPMVRT